MRHLVAAGDRSIRRTAGVGRSTRAHVAIDRASPAVGQFDVPPAGRHSNRLELRLGRRGCHLEPDGPCVPAVVDVRSLMGVGRTA